MKKKQLIKKLEARKKELEELISIGDSLGKEMTRLLLKHAQSLLDLHAELDSINEKLETLTEA